MNFKALLTVCIFVSGLIFVSYADSDAARFGRGKSFGSKPSMQKSMPAQSVQNKAPVAGATAGTTGAGAAAVSKPGLMGGMFGGLLAGTLLGSMLGGGLGGMGGGFMNILLIGLLIFIGYKLFQRFRSSQSASTSTASGPNMGSMQMPSQGQPMAREQSGSNWDNLQSASQGSPAGSQINMPQGFDADDFLRGAKMAYSRLQTSWDKRDLDDLSQFINPSVLDEIKVQLADDPNPSTTDILLVNAQLLEVKENAEEQTAIVYFDVLLREDPSQTTPTQIKEVWHFNRAKGSSGSWKLDGIQQVE